jgi:(R,R)-butanediol dehydrogenase/meso-butanediol dehydrogenase/diacetyl reductase
MHALQFSVTVPQWLALKTLGRLCPGLFTRGPLATLRLVEVAEPMLPGPAWVRIQTKCTGICASDLNLIFLRDSPSASPFTSFPCVMGHEVCGRVAEIGPAVHGVAEGDMVAVAPALSCEPRGIQPLCKPCAAGMVAACENTAEGLLAPGMFTGICRDTGGGFAPSFVAHESQLFRLPSGLAPEAGALVEPLSVALQAVLNNRPEDGDPVLVIGGGVIGGLIVRTLRALGSCGTIAVSDPSNFAAEQCRRAGADEIIADGDLFGHTARLTGARIYKPMMGPPMLMGGFGRVYDTVATSATLNTALRCLAAQGVLSLVGIGHAVTLDTTPLWLKMQTLKGVYGCSWHTFEGRRRHMFDIALDLVAAGRLDLTGLVTHTFVLEDFEAALRVNLAKDRHRAVKTVFAFDGR